MVKTCLSASVVWMVLAVSGTPSISARDLTFEERVMAQEAIERVYDSYRTGSTAPFEGSMPASAIAAKVRKYLKQSVALEQVWGTAVTAEMLRRETGRMTRETRFPDRLRELVAALDSDPVLVQECLARPILVDRLSRNFFAHDARIHDDARQRADELRRQLVEGETEANGEGVRSGVIDILRAASEDAGDGLCPEPRLSDCVALSPEAYERTRRLLPDHVGDVGPVREERDAFAVRVLLDESPDGLRLGWSELRKTGWGSWWSQIAPGLDESSVATVAANDVDLDAILPLPSEPGRRRRSFAGDAVGAAGQVPADDTWRTFGGALEPRWLHTAIWTGTEMIVWGGQRQGGGRYDPATDTWTSMSTLDSPEARSGHTAVWTGTEMVVWGGFTDTYVNDGGRYDPATDTWTPTATDPDPETEDDNAPAPRSGHTAVWTGTEMIVWSGRQEFGFFENGGRYDPATDTWTAMSTVSGPQPARGHSAAWTGTEMIVWGGFGFHYIGDGARYDPIADVWTAMSATGAPGPRSDHAAAWTGTEMIVWGGRAGLELYDPDLPAPLAPYFADGARYDPDTDTWTAMPTADAPSARAYEATAWTGDELVLWGGRGADGAPRADGARYDTAGDRWLAIPPDGNAPESRLFHAAVWAGDQLIVWGGNSSGRLLDTGGRYSPGAGTWTPTATGDTPEGRRSSTAVWTGSEMVIWGGRGNGLSDGSLRFLDDGSRYDPTTASWTPTSDVNAPSARIEHTAIWTGETMIVWGGSDGTTQLNTGAHYSPNTNAWVSTTTDSGPLGRVFHTAVWTGSQMILWGGVRNEQQEGEEDPVLVYPQTGYAYDPLQDTWGTLTTEDAPAGREGHAAVWSGEEMILWGGLLAEPQEEGDPIQVLPQTGHAYTPDPEGWRAISTQPGLEGRVNHTAVWTGSEMIVWGGEEPNDFGFTVFFNTGGRYDPATDVWTETRTEDAPAARSDHTATWTGRLMVVWGGVSFSTLDDGGRYDPATGAWTPTASAGAPSARDAHTAVWTGDEILIWGGGDQGRTYELGGAYGVVDAAPPGAGQAACAGARRYGRCLSDDGRSRPHRQLDRAKRTR